MEEQAKKAAAVRPRAGRPKKAQKGKSVTFYVTPEVEKLLDSYEGNRSQLINAAIAEYIARL